MKRDFYEELLNWKNENFLIPLMVVGARQIGKTYIIDKFCKDNFDDYIYINLFENADIINIFEKDISTSEKISLLEFTLRRKINENTVIFFDEVQESESLICALKYFNESDFPYHIICAGSLLGVKIHRFTKSFPVGKVIIKYMKALSFPEFLRATGDENLIEVIQNSFDNNTSIDNILHKHLLNRYRYYLCTGGMPQMVVNFIEKEKLDMSDSYILSSIRTSYIADMGRYTSSVYENIKNEKIYNNIASQLAKENKKYQLSKIEKNARYRDYENSVNWLLSSNLVIPCYYVNNFSSPLKAYVNDENFKLYFNDPGLLTENLAVNYNIILNDENFMFKGAIAENYVANELDKNLINLFYFYEPQKMGIDFLIDIKDGVIPIEVKAGDTVNSTSLNKYIAKHNPKYAIRISTKNFGFENKIKSVPLYAVFCIKKY